MQYICHVKAKCRSYQRVLLFLFVFKKFLLMYVWRISLPKKKKKILKPDLF